MTENDKKRMGRPRRLTDERVEEALRATGAIRARAAQLLGCSRQGVSDAIARSEYLQEIEQEVVEEVGDLVESKLFELIRQGNPQCVTFYLKNKCRNRGYSDKIRLDFPAGVVILPERKELPPDPDEVQPADEGHMLPPDVIPPNQEG